MDACEPAGYSRANTANGFRWQPTRQFGAYYAIACKDPSRGDDLDWDPDQRIIHCVAISRLVHPTALGFEYAARIIFGEDNEIETIIPFPGAHAYTVSNDALEEQRHWLNQDEWHHVARLVAAKPIGKKIEPPRTGRAMVYLEKLARAYHFPDRFELLVRTAEILWGVDWTKNNANKGGRGQRFSQGLLRLARELKVDLTDEDAKQAWNWRSQVTHGIGLPASGSGHNPNIEALSELESSELVEVYLKVEKILRRTMVKAIEDTTFSAHFASEKSLTRWLETGDIDESKKLARAHHL